MTYPIPLPADNAAPYTYTQPIRDAIGGVNTHQTQLLGLGPVHVVGNSGSALTLNASSASGSIKTITMTANCTFTPSGSVTGMEMSIELYLTQDATGGRTASWVNVRWPGGVAPVLSTAANAVDRIVLTHPGSGTVWYGDLIGKAYS